ncbi:MAG: Ig-like domain-containing protein [Lachnospiraceae bacterium]|nr:Ig-like domain-containing protein [Lachnospiraceae bacterium]
MKKMGKKIITGILITTMAVMTVACGNQTEPEATTEDITVKVSTEADKEMTSDPAIISIEQESFNVAFYLEAGESKSLAVDTDYEGKLEYTSSDDSVATIDENGKVTAVKNGTATMTVTAGDSKRTVNVIVRTLVAEEEPEEETDSTEQTQTVSNEANTTANTTGKGSQSTGGNTTANAGAGTSSGNNTTSGNNATSGTVTGSGNTTPSAPTTTEASNPGYNPADYYLDWYYIQDQVNARLLADYPNAIIARGITYNGVYYESGWDAGDDYDGTPGAWTTQAKIEDYYRSIKGRLDATNTPSDTYMAIGMFVESITVEPDGSRRIYITCYH